MSLTGKDIQAEMEKANRSDCIPPALLEKCAMLCNKYNLTGKVFEYQLEAFLMNSESGKLTVDIFGKFEQDLHKTHFQHSKQFIESKTPPSDKKRPSVLITPSDKGYSQPHGVSAADFLFPTTPESAPVTPSSTPGGNAFENRLNSGVSVATLNVHLGDRGDFEPSEAKPIGQCCRVNAAGLPQIGNVNASDDFPNVSERYRFMFTTLDERSRAIDKHLLSIQKDMCEGCFINELQPVGVPSPETVWICGRICNVAVEGKITKANIILEGSLSESGGRRVFLDVSELTEYSLFPGQVVCVQGINSGGRTMVAQRIIEGKALPLPTSKPESLLEMHYSRKYQGGKALKVRVTCGPYTTSDNLNFDPFMTLMAGVLADKPDVVIMLGPFVDINHPLLSSGQVYSDDRYGDTVEAEESFRKKTRTDEETADTYETLFRKRIGRDGFARFFNSEEDGERIETQFILIPSINDAFHECVFPQPPFGDRDEVQTSFFHEPLGRLDIPYSKESDGPLKRVHLLPNPCMFRINEVLFGTTSNDVLFSLSSDETSKIKENRLSRLSHHILQQQSFHPQFPNPPMANNTSIPVDMRHAKHWQMSKYSPDVLIIPSKLAPLVKDVSGTLVLNPGTATKGNTGGTYADMTIHPLSENAIREVLSKNSNENQPNEMGHAIVSRTCVKILKI